MTSVEEARVQELQAHRFVAGAFQELLRKHLDDHGEICKEDAAELVAIAWSMAGTALALGNRILRSYQFRFAYDGKCPRCKKPEKECSCLFGDYADWKARGHLEEQLVTKSTTK